MMMTRPMVGEGVTREIVQCETEEYSGLADDSSWRMIRVRKRWKRVIPV